MDDNEIGVETAAELRDGLRQDFRKLKATSEKLLAVAAAAAELMDRFNGSRGRFRDEPPSEDADLFAEWDTLDDALNKLSLSAPMPTGDEK